jgi:hypothetical protein
MTITLQPDRGRAIEEAVRAGAFRPVDEFIDAVENAILPQVEDLVAEMERLLSY